MLEYMRLLVGTDMELLSQQSSYEIIMSSMWCHRLQLNIVQLGHSLLDAATPLSLFNSFFILGYAGGNPASIAMGPSTVLSSKAMDMYVGLEMLTSVICDSVPRAITSFVPLNNVIYYSAGTNTMFVVVYMWLLVWGIASIMMNSVGGSPALHTQVLQQACLGWVLVGLDKVESVEEVLVLSILWPWCVLIIFSHLMSAGDQTVLFGFSEWGLPVTYGVIMLSEHLWTFGTYMFIYISGASGRRSSIVTLVEDIAAMAILVARVLLQAVRGVIVGMFHFVSRELVWSMSNHWVHNNVAANGIAQEGCDSVRKLPLLDIILNIVLSGGSFVVITGIMFLQLVFLLVSVWLFCKCWFTSWRRC